MDEGNFDAENSRLQIKKLKEKVKSLVSEVDLSREIRSDEFSKTSKFDHESNVNDISSESELSEIDSDEFFDFDEADFADETTWLLDRNSNCDAGVEPSKDIFAALYAEVDEFHADISDILRELQLLRNSSSSTAELNKSINRCSLIDSRTFTRPKKYSGRPPLTSIVSNSGDDGRPGKLQRRLTTTISPTPNIINKLEELSKVNNRPLSGSRSDGNWEEGSEEGLADIENSSRRSNRKTLPASIIDRLQELKRSNNSYISPRMSDKSRQYNAVNGNVDDSDRSKVSEDAKKVKAAFDLNVRNALSTSSRMTDLFNNIPEYFSDDNESFFSLDDVSGFCDRLTLSTDASNYSSIVREMEQNEIRFYHSGAGLEENVPLSRMTFGGSEIPMGNEANPPLPANSSAEQLVELDDVMNSTYVFLSDSNPKMNSTFEVKKGEGPPKPSAMNATYDAEKKSSLVDVILKSDIIKSLTPNYDYHNCDNKNAAGNRTANNANDEFNDTYTLNEVNKMHSEKYSSKIFDATFKKASPPDRPNGKKDSDRSEDDCMSTASENSYRSIDSNSELKNIEELKSIAMQQNKKLSDVKFSTPKLENTKPTYTRNSDEWRNFSPIRREIGDGESQGSSVASSRGPSPRGSISASSDGPPRSRPFSIRQPPKVPQRELKLKPALIQPTQNFKRMVSNGRPLMESTGGQRNECKTTASAAGIPVMRPSMMPVSSASSTTSTKPVVRASGIPRPPSRLKQPQIRASEVYRK